MARKRRGRGEGGLFYSEGKGVWIAREVVAGHRIEATGQTKIQARDRLAQARNRILQTKPASETIREYYQRWLETVSEGNVEPTTQQNYRDIGRRITDRIGDIRLADLTPRQVEDFYAQLRSDGYSSATVSVVAAVLGMVLGHAERHDLIDSSPTRKIRRPRAGEVEIDPFTADEVRLILEHAPAARRYQGVVVLALATGARLGELIGLIWEDYDPAGGMLRINRTVVQVGKETIVKRPKTRRSRRTIDLPDFARTFLEGWKTQARDSRPASTMFPSRSGGLAKAGSVRASWSAVLKTAKVRHRKFHACRHTHASQLLSAGVSIVEVARRLGDTPTTVLDVYAHYLPGEKELGKVIEGVYEKRKG